MAKLTLKDIQDIAYKRHKKAVDHAKAIGDEDWLNMAQTAVDNDVEQLMAFLNSDDSGSWRNATAAEIEDAVFNGSYNPTGGDYAQMLNDKENKEKKEQVIGSGAMKVVDAIEDLERGVSGELPVFKWQTFKGHELDQAMREAGYDPDNKEHRKDFMNKLVELTDQAKRAKLAANFKDSPYNTALAPFNTFRDEGLKQIATGKESDFDLGLAAGADVAANLMSAGSPKFFARGLNPLWQAGAEAVRQTVEGAGDVGDETFDLGNVVTAGGVAGGVAYAPQLLDLSISRNVGKVGGKAHEFKEGLGQGMIRDESEEALDKLKKDLTTKGAGVNYLLEGISNPFVRIGRDSEGKFIKGVSSEVPKQDFVNLGAKVNPYVNKPIQIGGIPTESFKRGSSFQLTTPELLFKGKAPNALADEGAYWRQVFDDKMVEAKKRGDESAYKVFKDAWNGVGNPKQAGKVMKGVELVRSGKYKLDPTIEFETGGLKTPEDKPKFATSPEVKLEARNQAVKHVATQPYMKESYLDKTPTTAKKAGKIAGIVLQGIGGRVEPVILEGRSPFSGLGEWFTPNYTEETWYKKLTPEMRAVVDKEMESHLLKDWNK